MGYARAGAANPPLSSATWPAVLAAGPLFLAAACLAGLYLQLPKPVPVTAGGLLTFMAMLFPALVVGSIVAALPVALAARALRAAGEAWPGARTPVAWALTGAGCGGLLARVTQLGFAEREFAFAIVVTPAICALIVWRRVYGRAA